MKYNVIAAFLGAASSVKLSQSVTLHLEEHKFEESLGDRVEYTPDYSGFGGNNHEGGNWRDAYEREVPEHLTGDTADTFTQKMIKEFAIEDQDEEGKPNGTFLVTHDKTRDAATEVLATHLNLKDKAATEYLDKYFEAVWKHMDVNETGKLEAVELNKFMRTLCKPVSDHIILE